ncbi:MAG: hypothetical protein QOG18_152, partial [Microbacteriaceae bacterium]|nr:hypothetical protein [Microbacteriaceae bacterium]
MVFPLNRQDESPWLVPSGYWPKLDEVTRGVDPPFGVISQRALAANAFSMLDRAAGTTIRVAS